MNARVLITTALVLACVAGAGFIASEQRGPGPSAPPAPARAASTNAGAGQDAARDYQALYRNGDLALNIGGAPGAAIFRSGLASLLRRDDADTPRARREDAHQRRICAQETGPAAVGRAALGSVPDSDPLSLGVLGAGVALLGWTRRRASWFDRLKQGWRFDVLPWPALCWLD